MSKDSVSDWSTTAGDNTDIAGINIDENCPPSGLNNAIRAVMSQIATARADWEVTKLSTDTIEEKTAAAGVTIDGVLLKDGAATLTGLLTATNANISSTGNVLPTIRTASANAVGIEFYQSGVTYWQAGVGVGDGGVDFNIYSSLSGSTGVMFKLTAAGAFSIEGRTVVDGSGDIPAARISTNLKDAVATGAILQSLAPAAYTATTAITTQLPADDTVPTSSEGDSILSQAITPVSASNKVRVRINGFGSHASGQRVVWALFRGTTYIGGGSAVSNSSYAVPINCEVVDSPATTSSTTYSLRVGPGGAAETCRLNYDYALGSRLFGGSAAVTMVVEEIKG